MSICNDFEVFSEFDAKLVEEIKLFNVSKNCVLFVTINDHVYQYCAIDRQLKKLEWFYENEMIIKIDFSNYKNYIHNIALTDKGRVYSWGCNEWSQLGNGTVSDWCPEPKRITGNGFTEHFITDISCGQIHSMALTRTCEVFTWGENSRGQCGNGNTHNQWVPIKIGLLNVIAIACGNSHSIALTGNGELLCWGKNDKQQLGIGNTEKQLIPLQLNGLTIKQIACGEFCTFMLTSDGDIVFCGEIPFALSHRKRKINDKQKFTEIAATIHSRLCVALALDGKCYIIGSYTDNTNSIINMNEFKQTEFTSIENAFAYYERITYGSVQLNVTKFIHLFDEENGPLGKGGFSTVFKCTRKHDNTVVAIKKISFEPIERERVLRELKILSRLQSKYVVKHIDSWIERNYYLNPNTVRNPDLNELLYSPNKTELLHIVMELCPFTLKDIRKILKAKCRTPTGTLSYVGYFIASELLYELLECVHYLHTNNPLIIHRDLKPQNILLNFVDNRFVKLSDFGISTFHEFATQTHTKNLGTHNYRAPELDKPDYDQKVDLFSLAVIMERLFLLDIRKKDNHLSGLKSKMIYMRNLIINQREPKVELRFNAIEVINDKQRWLLKDQQLLKDTEFNRISKSRKSNSIDDDFVNFFVQNKFNSELRKNNMAPQTSAQALPPLVDDEISQPIPMEH